MEYCHMLPVSCNHNVFLFLVCIFIAGFSVYDVAKGGCDIGMTTPVPFWGRFESAGR